MKFLIQHNLLSEEQLLKTKIAVENLPHEYIGLIPFSRELTSNEPLDGTDYIPYGSTLLTNIALEKNWKGLYFSKEKFNYEEYVRNRPDMLNDELIVTVEEAIDIFESTPDSDWFTRPSLDLKHYSGMVINSNEASDWFKDAMLCDSSGTYKMEPDMMVVLAKPKNIKREWRWFIVGGQIVSGSEYRSNGKLKSQEVTHEPTIAYAQDMADVWLPSPCCVMDTSLDDSGYKVIEFNCINSSGFYNNDTNTIFNELYNYSI